MREHLVAGMSHIVSEELNEDLGGRSSGGK